MNFKPSKRIDSLLRKIRSIREIRLESIEYVFKKDFDYLKSRIANESVRSSIKDEIKMSDYIIKSYEAEFHKLQKMEKRK